MSTADLDTDLRPAPEAFVHPALLYGSDEEYLATLVPFVTDGLALDEPVAVAVPGDRLRVLRAGLGDAANEITMIDMAVAGRNPGRIIAGVLRRFADRHHGTPVRIIGEPIWPGRTAMEYPACVQHEALINAAFTGRNVTIVCPYDTARLAEQVLADALETHPVVWAGDHRYPSDRYAPDAVLARYNEPLDDVDGFDGLAVMSTAEIAASRRFAVDRARHLGLGDEQVPDLQLVVAELVTNSLLHTSGGCHLRLWRTAEHLVCEVRDTGHLADPLAGRHPAKEGQLGGRGLLLVHALADLVRVHTTPDGTTIRTLFSLPADA